MRIVRYVILAMFYSLTAQTPLLDVMKSHNIEEINALWTQAADRSALLLERDREGNTPLMVAAYLDLVSSDADRDIISTYNAIDNENTRDLLGPMLGVASEHDKRAINSDGDNLLHIARSGKAMNILLDDPIVHTLFNSPNKVGQVPLHLADTQESSRRLLESYPFDLRRTVINLRDSFGNTPFFYIRNPDVGDYLLSNGADKNVVNKEGKTPLMHVLTASTFDVTPMPDIYLRMDEAKRIGILLPGPQLRAAMALFMIDRALPLNVKDKETGNTALHYAVLSDMDMVDKRNVVASLLASGAHKRIANKSGKTARDLAQDLNGDGSYTSLITALS